jgi:hypothetical protein
MLSVVMLNVIMLSVFMVNVGMLSVVMLNVVMLNVVAPLQTRRKKELSRCPIKLDKLANFKPTVLNN